MNKFLFGVSQEKVTTKVSLRLSKIAERNGATFFEADMPGTGYQRWFSGPNRGDPFNRALAQTVFDDMKGEGLEEHVP